MYWLIALIVSNAIIGATAFFLTKLHYKEKEEIFNRFMSLDFHQYQYFKNEYQKEVEHKEKVLEKQRDEVLTPEEKEAKKKSGDF